MPVAAVLKVFTNAMFNIFASFDRAVKDNQAETFRINNTDFEFSWESKYELLDKKLTDNSQIIVFREETTNWLKNYELEFSRFKTQIL